MKVRVFTLTKHSVVVNVEKTASIEELKARLCEDTGIPLVGQRLVFKGQELLSGTIDDYGLTEDDFVVVIVVKQSNYKNPDIISKMINPLTSQGINDVSEFQDEGLQSSHIRNSRAARHLDEDDEDEDNVADEEDDVEDLLDDEVDPDALQQLVDMGFRPNRATKALIITRSSTQHAMDWLLEHERDPDIDEPLTMEQLDRIRAGDEDDEYGDGGGESMLLDPQEAAQRLMELGFTEDDITYALDATGHDFEAAAAFLLGDYFPPPPPPPLPGSVDREYDDPEEDEVEDDGDEADGGEFTGERRGGFHGADQRHRREG